MDEEATMKRLAESGKIREALNLGRKIYAKKPSTKLQKRIAKMERYFNLYGENSDDEEEDVMIEVTAGFYLCKNVHEKLYGYQLDGIKFLWKLHEMKKGGVIADDMGLGKTIQVIAFLTGLFDLSLAKSVLIVLPVSLIPNWENEFQEWAPGLKVLQFYGTSKCNRETSLNKVRRSGGILLTSYGLARSQTETLSTLYGKPFKWDYVILDEAHAIKNPTQTTKALHKIEAHHRIALSGTPLQNTLRELWSLYDFTHEGCLLGSIATFKKEYETPIVRAREKCARPSEKLLGEKMAENLQAKIAPYFLRRTKAQVMSTETNFESSSENPSPGNVKACKPKKLPHKNDLIVWLYLTPFQQKLYEDFLQSDEVKSILMTKKSPLVQLCVMKKICDHPRILPRHACHTLGFDTLNSSATVDEAAGSIADTDLHSVETKLLIEESCKISFTLSLAKELKLKGHRTLIFSHSRRVLNILQKVLKENGFKIIRLDGTISDLADRNKRVNSFQNDSRYDIFLLTTKVGGVGLTLTAADRVIIFDPSWNPAVDNQAVDRAYRIGQDKPVIIYRLITCSTVEEKIYRRQIFKDSIIKQTTGDAQDPFRYFTKEELRSLFKLEDVRYSNTQKQLEEMHEGQRKTNDYVDEHLAFLHSLDIFGISDHDLMFSREEESVGEPVDAAYIQQRLARAEGLVQRDNEHVNKLKETPGLSNYTDYTQKDWRSSNWPSRKNKVQNENESESDTEGDMINYDYHLPPLNNFVQRFMPMSNCELPRFGPIPKPSPPFIAIDGDEMENKENSFPEPKKVPLSAVLPTQSDLVLVSDSEDDSSCNSKSYNNNFDSIVINETEDESSPTVQGEAKIENKQTKRRSCGSVIHKLKALVESPKRRKSSDSSNELNESEAIGVPDDVITESDDELPEIVF